MKTNTVRQPAHGKVSSRDVHEALVHSKKQAKPLTAPEHFAVREERTFGVRSGRTAVKHPYAAGTEHAVYGEFSTALIPDREILSSLEKVPQSQYETLKRGWFDFFLRRERRK